MKDIEKKNFGLFRADMYRILALGLDEPDSAKLAELKEVTQDLLKNLPDPFAGKKLRKRLTNLACFIAESDPQIISEEYNQLFLTKVLCASCEGSYQLAERGPIVGDITAFYKAFQLRFLAKEGPPDSIKMELGFLCTMALKEAYALENQWPDKAEITHEAQSKFLSDHLGRWGKLFASRLKETATTPFYQTLADCLTTWLDEEIKYFQINPQSFPATLPSFSEEAPSCEAR